MKKSSKSMPVLLVTLLLLATQTAQATPPIGGNTLSFGTGNDAGASAYTVRSVALGDLDGDGDLDLVSGRGEEENYEVIAWQNDGSPFSGTWTPNDVGASTATVRSVALGDLDIVSGGARRRITRSSPGGTTAPPSAAPGRRTTWGPAWTTWSRWRWATWTLLWGTPRMRSSPGGTTARPSAGCGRGTI
ncbi:MAG: hypothetical protein ACE5OS_07320 [Anaerolineae bacterium]